MGEKILEVHNLTTRFATERGEGGFHGGTFFHLSLHVL